MKPMKELLVLGIMSGTSIDSVDYALCQVGFERVRLRRLWQANYPRALHQRLVDAARGLMRSYELGQLHHDLGRFYAAAAMREVMRTKVDLVALHGQTVFHHPSANNPASFQLGEPAYLAEQLRAPVVSNFRAADLAAGGQGAPLATLFHWIIFGRVGSHVCVNNLGGISNVTAIHWTRSTHAQVRAFDTGPGILLIDLASQTLSDGKRRYDRNGAWALRGKPDEALLAQWLRHPFFGKKPPKSTGREMFGETFFQGAFRQLKSQRLPRYDILATFTEFTARSLALNYRRHLDGTPDLMVLTGGGAANQELIRRIRAQFSSATAILPAHELGWPLKSIEPAAFALLAYYRWAKKPANIPSTTGAKRPVLLGQITEV